MVRRASSERLLSWRPRRHTWVGTSGVHGGSRHVRSSIRSVAAGGLGDPRGSSRVGHPDGGLSAAVTRTGTLVFVPGGPEPRRCGRCRGSTGRGTRRQSRHRRARYGSARLSPDGTRIAVNIRDEENDIWVWDLARQTLTRLTFDADIDLAPVWAPDGRRVVFASTRTGVFNLYTRDADGAAQDVRLTTGANTQLPDSVTPDGAFVIGHEVRPQTRSDLVRFARDPGRGGGAIAAQGLVETPFEEWNGELSPDGRFLAYQSNESGDIEVYVRTYPEVANARWQVSRNGGSQPVWTRGGRELIYLDGAGHLTAVPVSRRARRFALGHPRRCSPRRAPSNPPGVNTTCRPMDSDS